MHYLFPPGFLSGFLWGERPTALGTPRRFQGCRPADPLPPIPNTAPKRPWPPARQPLGCRLPRRCWPCPNSPNNQANWGVKTMKRLDKERRKLEKVGFSGQTLERAMELLERTNASILSELLVKMVTRQEKTPSMALYEMETKTRELEAKLGLSPKEPF